MTSTGAVALQHSLESLNKLTHDLDLLQDLDDQLIRQWEQLEESFIDANAENDDSNDDGHVPQQQQQQQQQQQEQGQQRRSPHFQLWAFLHVSPSVLARVCKLLFDDANTGDSHASAARRIRSTLKAVASSFSLDPAVLYFLFGTDVVLNLTCVEALRNLRKAFPDVSMEQVLTRFHKAKSTSHADLLPSENIDKAPVNKGGRKYESVARQSLRVALESYDANIWPKRKPAKMPSAGDAAYRGASVNQVPKTPDRPDPDPDPDPRKNEPAIQQEVPKDANKYQDSADQGVDTNMFESDADVLGPNTGEPYDQSSFSGESDDEVIASPPSYHPKVNRRFLSRAPSLSSIEEVTEIENDAPDTEQGRGVTNTSLNSRLLMPPFSPDMLEADNTRSPPSVKRLPDHIITDRRRRWSSSPDAVEDADTSTKRCRLDSASIHADESFQFQFALSPLARESDQKRSASPPIIVNSHPAAATFPVIADPSSPRLSPGDNHPPKLAPETKRLPRRNLADLLESQRRFLPGKWFNDSIINTTTYTLQSDTGPIQPNSTDCGVYVVAATAIIARNDATSCEADSCLPDAFDDAFLRMYLRSKFLTTSPSERTWHLNAQLGNDTTPRSTRQRAGELADFVAYRASLERSPTGAGTCVLPRWSSASRGFLVKEATLCLTLGDAVATFERFRQAHLELLRRALEYETMAESAHRRHDEIIQADSARRNIGSLIEMTASLSKQSIPTNEGITQEMFSQASTAASVNLKLMMSMLSECGDSERSSAEVQRLHEAVSDAYAACVVHMLVLRYAAAKADQQAQIHGMYGRD
ncbi:hypothetical protein EsH8_XII_000061 [Colletotrichum jinshuiense]